MADTHHLKAKSIESATEVSTPELSVLLEKIQLIDSASNAEKGQMSRWARERFEEIRASLEDGDILGVAQNELSNFISNDAMQALIEILKNMIG